MTESAATGTAAGAASPGAGRRRVDTRSEIIATAMTLFAENGYDKTSLREIAEAVGVTKAALYYHFRTKADIVGSALHGYTEQLAALIEQADAAPAGPERDTELVDGLLALFATTGGTALRFGQANPTVMSQLHIGEQHVSLVKRLVAVLAGDGPPAEATIRATLAFGALVIGTIGDELTGGEPVGAGRAASTEEGIEAARTVALELLHPLTAAR